MTATLAPPPVRMRTLSSPSTAAAVEKASPPQASQPHFATFSRATKWSPSSSNAENKDSGKASTFKRLRAAASCNNLLSKVVGSKSRASAKIGQEELQAPIPWPKHPICFRTGCRVDTQLQQPVFSKRLETRSLLSKLAAYVMPYSMMAEFNHCVEDVQHGFLNEAPYPFTYSSEALRRYGIGLSLVQCLAHFVSYCQ